MRVNWSGPLTDTWPEAKAAEQAERERVRSMFTTVDVTGRHSYGPHEAKVTYTSLACCKRCGAYVGDKKGHDAWHRSLQPIA